MDDDLAKWRAAAISSAHTASAACERLTLMAPIIEAAREFALDSDELLAAFAAYDAVVARRE